MSQVTVAATQMSCSHSYEENIREAERLVREAAAAGAQIILLQELFESPYFCKDQLADHFALASPFEGHPTIARMSRLAAELGVVLPVSFFERATNAYFNSLAVIDANGEVMGIYRKSHIPDGPGYQEKFYFTPGDTGFQVWQTKFATIGVGICWDQWFPEAARSMALRGAEILFYPTAIGSEPQAPGLHSRDHWRRVMQGHAGANMTPVVASNRVGTEDGRSCSLTFYGGSFITDETGGLLAECDDAASILTATLDLDAIRQARASWGLFRDRRPDLYLSLLTFDGRESVI